MSREPTRIWIVVDDKAGNEMPARGLAERVADRTPAEISLKRVAPKGLWRHLPPPLWLPRMALQPDFPLRTLDPQHRPAPPWPDLVIGCGRVAAPFTAAIRRLGRATPKRPLAVQILDPHVPSRHFELVIVPEHDRKSGPGILTVVGSLSRVTPAGAEREARRLHHLFDPLPRPLIGVLVGGSSKAHRMTPAATTRLIDQLRQVHEQTGAGFAVTLSRRTGEENAARIREGLNSLPAFVWDGTGDNPYQGILGAADTVVVTEDSVNMASDAAAAGKPVLVAPLEGGSRKLDRFHAGLRQRGNARLFRGAYETWTPAPLDETGRAAGRVLELLKKKMPDP